MLVTLKEILTKAKQENYAVPACNIDNEHKMCIRDSCWSAKSIRITVSVHV